MKWYCPTCTPRRARRPPAPLQGLLRLPTRGGRVVILSGRFDAPSDFEWPSKVDRAISAGFDPGEDHGGQPVMAPGEWDALSDNDPRKQRQARWVHQGSRGCEACGERCDDCGDRMCSQWGPAPLPRCPQHPCCADCEGPIYCRECRLVLAEHANDKDDR